MSDQLRDDLLKMMKEKAYRKGEYKLSSGKAVSTMLIVNLLS